ncbi:MAG: hypothetical protein K6G22_01750, partial [Lachnospiraceae bacterium]|nr:hypothetical protein [Lachnospiraceae bacterium]
MRHFGKGLKFLLKLSLAIYCIAPWMAQGVSADPLALNISMTGWEYGNAPDNPAPTIDDPVGYFSEPTIEYKTSGDGDENYSSSVPAAVGDYIVRVSATGSDSNIYQG